MIVYNVIYTYIYVHTHLYIVTISIPFANHKLQHHDGIGIRMGKGAFRTP